MAPPAAAEAEEEAEEDIEVDLGLQQALIQSIAPSPAQMHTKGNTLHDISNWGLPTPGKKQGAGAGVSPLQALTAPKGDTHTHTHTCRPISAACMMWVVIATAVLCHVLLSMTKVMLLPDSMQ